MADVRVTELKEVIVTPSKQKYSKKNNPAVELMRQIRKKAKESNPERREYYSYDRYDKTILGLNDFYTDIINGSEKWRFMAEYIDTAFYTGKRILNMSLHEKFSTRIVSQNPAADKEIIIGKNQAGVDEVFNQGNVQMVLDDVLREIDVYKNDITIMQNRFVGPFSHIAPDFYKYQINDTVVVDGERCVELVFMPHNPQSFGFNGRIYVVADTTYFVKRIALRAPQSVNLNYVKNIYISQNFQRDSLGYRHKTLDDVSLELQIIAGTQVFYGRRVSRYANFSYSPREDFQQYYTKLGRYFELDDASEKDTDFWNANRLEPLSRGEKSMYDMMGKMRKIPVLYWLEKLLGLLERGYFTTGKKSKVDLGPVNTLISYNSVEGVRLRVGGMTTALLNPHLFGRAYIAYGFKDRKLKYMGEMEYSFDKKKYHAREFPIHLISVYHSYDIDNLGQHYLFTNPDNVVLSWKRKNFHLATYRRLSKFSYKLELTNNFSIEAGLRHEIQEATPMVPFLTSTGKSDRRFMQTYIHIGLRYAPGEKFVQGRTSRAPVNMDAPIFQLTHDYGPQNLFGSAFVINRTEFSFQKRFWFSAFGYSDVIFKAGKVWSTVQYPFLLWQNANLSYTIQPESYSLMNPMEFATDAYTSLDLTYWGNGVLFNLIPGFKKLKLREVVTFKGLMGTLSRKNNPAYNDNLYLFPTEADTHTLSSKPYMELGVGIDNIFTILRVDYVWRLTYRDMPGIDRSGIRVSLHFSF